MSDGAPGCVRTGKFMLELIAAICAFGVWAALDHGTRQLIAAFLLGSVLTIVLFGWLLGFDVRSLSWQQGAFGERWTADELTRLPPTWHVRHDIPNGKGNWDHVVVGPGGVFAVDSKNLAQPSFVDEHGLRAGRLRLGGSATRRSAVQLKELIVEQSGEVVWVQGVLAIWGTLPDERIERDKVLYVRATKLVEVLQAQPTRLDDAQRERVAAAVDAIAGTASAR